MLHEQLLQGSVPATKFHMFTIFLIGSSKNIVPRSMNESTFTIHAAKYLRMFEANSVFQLLAENDNPLHSPVHISRPKVPAVSLSAVRNRLEYGYFQRPKERKPIQNWRCRCYKFLCFSPDSLKIIFCSRKNIHRKTTKLIWRVCNGNQAFFKRKIKRNMFILPGGK